jgi:hypothetical protein
MAFLSVDAVSMAFPGKGNGRFLALDSISLDVEQGEFGRARRDLREPDATGCPATAGPAAPKSAATHIRFARGTSLRRPVRPWLRGKSP